MGVGKGRFARELAAATDYFAVDTDDLIESFENRKIKKIFKTEGEAYFRRLEQKVADWLEWNVKCTVISTGGGFFAVPNLNRIGTVVFLRSSFETIVDEMVNHPKAHNKDKKAASFSGHRKGQKAF